MDVPAILAVTIGPLLIVGVILYTYVQATLDDVREDWVKYRCNPLYMPFAGSIQPDISTADNFQYCMNSFSQQVFGILLDPIYALFNVFNNILSSIVGEIGYFRNFISGMQTFITSFTSETFLKIQTSFSVLISLMTRTRDIINRIVGSAGYSTAIAITSVNLIEALVGYMKSVIIALVSILFALGIILAFVAPEILAFAIFLGTFVGLSYCFHPDTPIELIDGTIIPIRETRVGDILSSGARVTAVMYCLAEGVPLYDYEGTIVSGTHLVKENGKWIYVSESSKSVPYTGERPFDIICLNTSDHQIPINGNIFADYEEIEEELDYEPLEPTDTIFTLGGKVPLEKCYPGLPTVDGVIRTVVYLENDKMQLFMGNSDGYFYINGGTRRVRDYPDSHDPEELERIQHRVLAQLNS